MAGRHNYGYRKVSLEQALALDQEVFLRMAEETRGGLAVAVTGDTWFPFSASLASN